MEDYLENLDPKKIEEEILLEEEYEREMDFFEE